MCVCTWVCIYLSIYKILAGHMSEHSLGMESCKENSECLREHSKSCGGGLNENGPKG